VGLDRWWPVGREKLFYADYGDPLQMTVPFILGFEIVKLGDEHVRRDTNRKGRTWRD